MNQPTHGRQSATTTRSAVCPSCGKDARFVLLGEQRWPARVAETMKVPPVIRLWRCGQCHTTISESAFPADA